MSGKLRLLDLFCCAGGAARGYQRAGFHVTGADIEPRDRYAGDEFEQRDFRSYTPEEIRSRFDAAHASPPCQKYSDLAKRNANAHEHPDYIDEVRDLLIASGLPYIIENVDGAPLRDPVVLCGTMFLGLRVLRHRGFESNISLTAPPHGKHPLVFTHDKRKAHYGKLDQDTSFVQVTGGGNCSVANAADAMGIDWMTKDELNEAIPPAFTEHLGKQLIQHLQFARVAA